MYEFLSRLFWGEQKEEKKKPLLKLFPFDDFDFDKKKEHLVLVKGTNGIYHVAKIIGDDKRVYILDEPYGVWVESNLIISDFALIESKRLDK